MINTKKMKDVAAIATGYSFRQAVRNDNRGVRVIQIRDFDGFVYQS